MQKYIKSALIGILFAIPFVLFNTLVANKVELFLSVIRPNSHTTLLEQIILFSSLLLVFVGGLVALSPLLNRGIDGKRRFYFLNIIVGLLLTISSATLIFTFGEEIYRCDIQQISNCD